MRFFHDQRYTVMASELREAYNSIQPFPHTVIDNFLPAELADRILQAFPGPDDLDWNRFDKHHSKKLATKIDSRLPDTIQDILQHFNSAPCLRFLEGLTGIDGLLPDPYFEGGGLHQIEPGGWLKIHTDFNYHNKLKLDRRINLIVYFNKNWQEEYHGHLELWDREMTHCVRKVLPVFNRCVVFNTTDWSYHGHPEILTCPPGWTRKSVALYYYTNGRPDEEKSAPHGTQWQERPNEQLPSAGRKGFGALLGRLFKRKAA